MKYNELDWGRMEAIVNKLGGMEGVDAFLAGKREVVEQQKPFKVWKIVHLTACEDSFYQLVEPIYNSTTSHSYRLLQSNLLSAARAADTIVPLVKVSVRDLGLLSSATLNEVYTTARKKFRLAACPMDVAPVLQAEYNAKKDMRGWLRIATMFTVPANNSNAPFAQLTVGRDDYNAALLAGTYTLSCKCDADEEFVFSYKVAPTMWQE